MAERCLRCRFTFASLPGCDKQRCPCITLPHIPGVADPVADDPLIINKIAQA